MTYSVSMRGKDPGSALEPFLTSQFPFLPFNRIDTLFGFVERATLYGGRPFIESELSAADVESAYNRGLGIKLPLSNHFVTEEEYRASRPFLEKYHRPGNAAAVVNDELARWMRRDFPQYKLEASVIKDIRSMRGIGQALELYDTVVLPMDLNRNQAFLEAIPDKSRVRLFANAGCAYLCPLKLCYKSISKMNKYRDDAVFRCSQDLLYRPAPRMVDFDVARLRELGFTQFKLLRSNGPTAY